MKLEQKWKDVRESAFFEEFYFLAIALILAFGLIQTAGAALDTDKPVVTVVSCSMYPHYNVGDVIMVKGESFENIEEGEIIVYDAESESVNIPIIHRVVEKRENSLETRGDNTRGQHDFEQNITADQIHGEAFLSIPRIGLVKILTMDLIGFSGDQPLVIDNTPACQEI